MLLYTEAQALMSRARDNSRKLGNNTYLHRRYRNYGDTEPSSYAVQLHGTDVVSIHPDGTYTLSTGGWNTVTTKSRLNDYGPARVYSIDGTLCVVHRDDPRTPEKISKCRACKGTGIRHTTAWQVDYGPLPYPVYEVKDEFHFNTERDGETYPVSYISAYNPPEPLRRDGQPVLGQPKVIRVAGQVTVHPAGSRGKLPEPILHPSKPYTCNRCNGAGSRDYGSKSRPVIFYDGITVDSTGKVTDPDAERLYPTPEEVAAEQERREAAARKAARDARKCYLAEKRDFIAHYALTPVNGKVIVYKTVNDSLVSGNGFAYPIGETVACSDWEAGAYCGNGLHFWPTIGGAVHWPGTRYLACEISVKDMVVIDGNKMKAPSAKVLHEVDGEGNRL